MKLGYVRTVDIDADILVKSEQLIKLNNVKCDEIVEEQAERIGDCIADRLSSGDTLVITNLNILGKMTGENIEYIDSLLNKGISIDILDLGLIEAQESRAYELLQTFYRYEKSCLKERLMTAKKVAKQKEGFKEGRPRLYTEEQIEEGLKLLENHSYSEAAKICGISVATLNREKKKREKAMKEME